MRGNGLLCRGALALVLLWLGGCAADRAKAPVTTANPASVHCVERGGRLEIVKGPAGEEGICHLPDGTAVDEWELFRRDSQRR